MSGPTEEDDEMLAQFYSMSLDELLEASRRTKSRILALQQEMEIVSTVLEMIKESKQEITPGEASLLGGTHSRGESSLSEEDGGNNDPDSQRQGKSVVVKISERGESSLSEEDGGNNDPDSQRQGKSVVVKISERETIDLPVDGCGLVDPGKLKPGDDLSGVDEETLPPEYSSVKAMEVDEKPTENYNDIGGLEKQIQELDEAIVLSLTHKDRFQKSGIRQPKGVLLFGPPGTGKTLIARACAAQTDASFVKLAGAQIVQMDIGGAKLVHDAFQLAKEKSPCIIFIDKIDAIGAKCSDSEASRGSREVERTILEELLSQLDGFSSDDSIKVIATTNCIDILDPALMCSGRLDHKIEIPHPNEEGRARILQIHSRTMNVHPNVNFKQLARLTDGFSGAQLKAVCVEAGMVAIRRDATEINHEDFTEGVIQVEAKKKASFN